MSEVTSVYLGNQRVTKIYSCVAKVWPTDVPPTPTPYEEQYLTFRMDDDGTASPAALTWNSSASNVIYYSLDSGATWTQLASGQATSTLNKGDVVMFKGVEDEMIMTSDDGIGKISCNGSYHLLCSVEGNIMSLLYGDNFIGQTSLANKNYAFKNLFNNEYIIVSIDNLVLPATTLAPYCYQNMFNGCRSLTSIPSGLLPATTLADSCYSYMFGYCTSLTTIQSGLLPATSLTEHCYGYMFTNCSGLTSVAEDLLPARTLAPFCYYSMFANCTLLRKAPKLPTERLTQYKNGTSCYTQMFYNCKSLNKIWCYAINITSTNSLSYWVNGVAASGTFYKNPNMNDWSIGVSGIPSGWVVEDWTPSPNPPITNPKWVGVFADGHTEQEPCDSSILERGEITELSTDKLTSLQINDCVMQIAHDACSGFTSLSSLTLSNNLTSIGYYAFRSCSSLTAVTIPDSVINLGERAFSNTNIKELYIGSGLTSMGNVPFENCNITSLTINSNSFVSASYVGGGSIIEKTSSAITELYLGEGIMSIGDNAFHSKGYPLSSVTMPSTLTSIGYRAFRLNTHLPTITIPSGVTTIGDGAFDNCYRLQSIVVEAITPPALGGSNVFNSTNNAPIIVPQGTLAAYQSAWSQYADRLQEAT